MFEELLKTMDMSACVLEKGARAPFAQYREREKWQALKERDKREILSWGERAKARYPQLTASMYMAFGQTGDRQVFETPYFERRRLLIGATLSECITGKGDYLPAVADGLWMLCEETTWVISAHNKNDPLDAMAQNVLLPDIDNPYIDLFAAQTAQIVAYVLYFLAQPLNALCPMLVRRARRELERRIIVPFLTRDDFWWMGVVRKDLNNWTPWILSNVIDVLLLEGADEQLAYGLRRAMRMLDRYVDVLPEDGGLDEGCGYWNMAGGALLDCLERLYDATGGRLDVFSHPVVRALALFPLKAHIAGEYFWNFADCDAKPFLDGERVYAFGKRVGSAALCALGSEIYDGGQGVMPRDTAQMGRVLCALFNAPPPLDRAEDEERNVALPQLQAYAFERGGIYAAIKGGHNDESHNHNDVGSFLVYVDGQPAIVDAGNMTYTAKSFSAQRYTLWNTRSKYHNVALINGAEQGAGRACAAREVRAAHDGVTMELRDAYPGADALKSYTRSLQFEGEAVELLDNVTLSCAGHVEFVFMLRGKPTLTAGCAAFCGLEMRFDAALDAQVEEIPVVDARMARSFPGSLWRLVLCAQGRSVYQYRFTIERVRIS